MNRWVPTLLVAFLLVVGAASLGAAQEAASADMEDYTIPEGTEFKLQLHTSINSKTSKPGDRIIATLYDPVFVYDENVLHKGTRVDGHVGEVKPAARRGKGGYLTLVFDSVALPNGEKQAILGSLTEVFSSEGGGDPIVGVEGDLKGRGASRKKQLILIAIPTGGAAATGSVGVAAAVGAATTVAALVLPRGKQASLETGSLVGMRLDRDVTFSLPVNQN